MAVRPVYTISTTPWPFDYVGGAAAAFVNGESFLTFGPPFYPEGGNYAIPHGTYYLARRMWFEGGIYEVRALVDDAATWWMGGSWDSRRLVFSHIGEGVRTGSFYVPPGEHRFDIVVENVPESPTPCWVIFSIWREGKLVYASNGAGWVWDTDPIPDDDLVRSDDRLRRLPVWTVLPNWKNGIIERLSWLTDAIESEAGVEQRRALRAQPFRSIEASFLREGSNRERLDTLFAALGQREFLLPLWHEQVRMLEGITFSSTGVAFAGTDSTRYREFRQGDLVFVNAGDPNDFELLEVGTVEENRFDWARSPKREWPAGTRIFPCRTARVIDAPQLQNVGDRVGIAQVRFELVEPFDWPAQWDEYVDGLPFFEFQPDRRTDVTLDYTRLTFTLDNGSSVPWITDFGRQARIGMRLGFTLFGREQVAKFRNRLHAMRGRAVTFLIPTYSHDLQPKEPLGGKYILAEPIGYELMGEQPQLTRTMLRIEADDREPIYRRIVSMTPIYDQLPREYVVRFFSSHMPGAPADQTGIFKPGEEERLFTPVSGLNLVVIEGTTGDILYHRTYAIGGEEGQPLPPDDAARRDALVTELNALAPNVVIILYAADHFNGGGSPWGYIFTQPLVQAIERCGGTSEMLNNFKRCAGYMLLGVPGIGRGRGIELYSGSEDYPTDAAFEYTVRLVNGRPIDIEGMPFSRLLAERYELDVDVPPIALRSLRRISFVAQSRLDQDAVEMKHYTTGSRGVECSLFVRQIHNRRVERF